MATTLSPTEPPRYRVENGQSCIDVSIREVEEIFDKRDPAPFRRRDLDPDLIDYLYDAGEDLMHRPSWRVVLWTETPCSQAEVAEAIHGQFRYLLERSRRRRAEQRRSGRVALAFALVISTVLLFLAQGVLSHVSGAVGGTLKEGMVILGWIVLWRPVELLLYDGIPLRRERRVMSRLLASPVEVRPGIGPDAVPDRG